MKVRTLSKDAQLNREGGVTFFVSTDGNDCWSGRLEAPNKGKTDGPFATLARARDALREMKEKKGLKEPVTVMAREGKYFLTKTVVLGPEDSGTRECPITYTAYPGEKPVLSGGRKLSGWKPYKDKILQCSLPETKGGKQKLRQLFFNGQRQIRARYPNFDPENPLYGGWAFVEGPAEKGSFVSFKYKPGTFKHRWAKPAQGEAYLVLDWGVTNIIPIKTIDEKKHAITVAEGVKDFNLVPYFRPMPFGSRSYRFYVENLLEELDQPGEWCLDSDEGILYFWPPGPIEEAEVVAPDLDCLIDLQGASRITISGLTFTETTGGDNMHRQGYEGYSAMFPAPGRKYCGEALLLKGAEHCSIQNNHFSSVGGNAIYLEDYNLRNLIQYNEISYAGACGIVLIGSEYSHPVPHHPLYNQVSDNHIHHCGVFDKYIAGVFLGLSDGNLIAHNLIEQLPHHAINLGGSGYGRNILEYNKIRRTCLETNDANAINSWMEDPCSHTHKDAQRSGHIVRYNLITDTRGCKTDEEGNLLPGGSFGIRLDNYASNCFIYGNIIVRSTISGFTIHGGKNNIFENNIIVESKHGVRYVYGKESWSPQRKRDDHNHLLPRGFP